MVSEVDICNNALLKVRAKTITALDQLDSNEALSCNIMYPQMRDDVLAAHPWNFAIKQINLNPDAAAPLFEFTTKFRLPEDCLRVVKVATSTGVRLDYKVKGRFLHSNTQAIFIEYISREKDTTKFSPQYVDTLATRIGSEIGFALTGSDTRASTLAKQYIQKLKEAKRRDGQEGTPDRVTANTFVNSRDSGTRT